MPELPEVEVVRRGLETWISGRTLASVEVLHPRAVRRHLGDFTARLTGRTFQVPRRRGKYMWVPLDDGAALLAHLGMSGQLLVGQPESPVEKHLRVRFGFPDLDLRFVDQRTFGHVLVSETTDGIPDVIAHIAPDPFEPAFDEERFYANLKRRRTGVKRALLDQTLISGVGNIYADEALWRTGLHGERPTEKLTRKQASLLLQSVREVMGAALEVGGTSFDSLYVNVNGESGYFDRSLNAYGRRDEPCARCGTPIIREVFMNRSSFSCPRCQPRPRS